MNIDTLIIFTAELLGWLVLAAINLLLLYICFVLIFRCYMNAVGWPILRDALVEYRRNHPEKYKHFDKIPKL